MTNRSIAVCHEWVTTYGGSEQVASRLAQVLNADAVYTFTAEPHLARELFPERDVIALASGAVGKIARDHWKWLLPAMPAYWARADLSGHDVVVTSSHSCVNAIHPAPGAVHISYCHTPMRYAWDWRAELRRLPAALRPAWPPIAAALRRADRKWAQRVTRYIANSHHVARRIRAYYGRDADVVYPPIDTDFWTPDGDKEDFFLIAGRLVSYKRADIAVRAATELDAPLVVAGNGPEYERLTQLAGQTVEFVRQPSREELRDLYRRATALVFAGIEDFGMTLVEAQACGTPVIAYAQGGALEAVANGTTGLLYEDPSVGALMKALQSFVGSEYTTAEIRRHAETFAAARFDEAILEIVARLTTDA